MIKSYIQTFKKIILSTLVLSVLPANITAFAVENFEMVSPGIYQMTDGSTLSGVHARGIDVSRWQGSIDWQKVAKSDVKFAMIATRNRKTGTADQFFHANMEGAYKNGIALGAYIYSYALNPEEAKQEAEFVLNLIKDYPIRYPIAFDVEDEVQQGKMTKEELNAIIDAFCNTIKAAGYYPIVYANEYWLNNKLDASVARKYPIWVARYAPKFTFPNPVIWQASSTAKVNGISGNVDINFQFTNFDNTTPATTWRTILGKKYYYDNYQMQKNRWANEGNQRYYLSDSGTLHKGWLNLDNREYYLNADSGILTTGWKKFDNAWSFFDTEGILKRGWIMDGGKWYLLDKNGYMLTNWVQTKGKTYFLHPNGSMATGWIKQDNSWLYLNGNGEISKGWLKDSNSWYFLDKNGNMLTGSIYDGNKLYYMNTDGSMANGWTKQGDFWYCYSSDGAMQSGWILDGGEWYFLDADGKMATGLQSIDQNIYYFEQSGRMLHDSIAKIDGTDYEISSSGAIANYPYSGSTKSGATKEVRVELTSSNYIHELGKNVVSAFNLDTQVSQGARQTTAQQDYTSDWMTRPQGEAGNSMLVPNSGNSTSNNSTNNATQNNHSNGFTPNTRNENKSGFAPNSQNNDIGTTSSGPVIDRRSKFGPGGRN